MTEDPIIKFLEGSEKDFQGRFIKDIWNYSDNEIESINDFIQVIFPLDEQRKNSSSRFFIQDQVLIPAIQSSEFAQANFKQSYKWFFRLFRKKPKMAERLQS